MDAVEGCPLRSGVVYEFIPLFFCWGAGAVAYFGGGGIVAGLKNGPVVKSEPRLKTVSFPARPVKIGKTGGNVGREAL